MKYELETRKINDALKEYAWAIISNSSHSKRWNHDTLKLFVEWFVGDEVKFGRIAARLNLLKNLEEEYNMT